MQKKIAIFWFRRDLRLEDNAGLYYALKSGYAVLPLFVFDRNILDDLEDKSDRRIDFIHQSLAHLKQQLQGLGSDLLVKYNTPPDAWKTLLSEFNVAAVFTNHDYEPYARTRDAQIGQLLASAGIAFHTFKDQVIFEEREVTKKDGGVYTVFTPYSRSWKAKLNDGLNEGVTEEPDSSNSTYLAPYPSSQLLHEFLPLSESLWFPDLASLGFSSPHSDVISPAAPEGDLRQYDKTRDFPALDGTSRLGIHLRFGTISIRDLVRRAIAVNEVFLNQLIWRDFYMQILANFPHVAERCFKPEYEFIQWLNNEDAFRTWCNGQTGYPLVDAGMRQLNLTGYMHNRLRMVTASFLTKHLLIDWRWGEAYFATKLLDFDLAANNGGWQWAAGCGTDAAPYFRIFNPASQAKKFDKDAVYIKRWVPEYGTPDYPEPMVDHAFARTRCLETYKQGLAQGKRQALR